MAYIPPNQNGQALMANSAPIVIASDQTSLPTAQKEQSGTATKILVDELSGELQVTDASVLQELQEIKLLMQEQILLLHQIFNI